jgi:glycosyltransferase involved in cell wall biosynthesis
MRVLPSFLPDSNTTSGVVPPAAGNYALFVGRLEKLKGLQDLIPAFKADSSLELLIVGEGDYGEELRRLAGGSAHIRFLGRKTPEDLEPLYAAAAAVVMPSVCHEVFPLVALEAFRAGTPIVARDLGPFPEIIEKSGAGFLFKDPADAHRSTKLLADDAGLRAALGAKARQAVATHWSETAAMTAYFNLVAEKAAAKDLSECAETARALASF